jgi:hypothetical protein
MTPRRLPPRLGARLPARRRRPQVRLYDARGHARTIDPSREPGRALVRAAEELIRAATP